MNATSRNHIWRICNDSRIPLLPKQETITRELEIIHAIVIVEPYQQCPWNNSIIMNIENITYPSFFF